jgi:hypothetical protein
MMIIIGMPRIPANLFENLEESKKDDVDEKGRNKALIILKLIRDDEEKRKKENEDKDDKTKVSDESSVKKRMIFNLPFYGILSNPSYQTKFGFFMPDCIENELEMFMADHIRNINSQGTMDMSAESILTMMLLNFGYMP